MFGCVLAVAPAGEAVEGVAFEQDLGFLRWWRQKAAAGRFDLGHRAQRGFLDFQCLREIRPGPIVDDGLVQLDACSPAPIRGASSGEASPRQGMQRPISCNAKDAIAAAKRGSPGERSVAPVGVAG